MNIVGVIRCNCTIHLIQELTLIISYVFFSFLLRENRRLCFIVSSFFLAKKESSVAILGTIFIVIASMSNVSLTQFLHFIPQIVTIIIIGQIGILVGGFIFSKVFKLHPYKGMSLALTSMFGFPADYILYQEVSRSVGRTEEEQQTLLNELSPPMLIAGFTTETVAPVVIASILVKSL